MKRGLGCRTMLSRLGNNVEEAVVFAVAIAFFVSLFLRLWLAFPVLVLAQMKVIRDRRASGDQKKICGGNSQSGSQ